MTTEGEPDGNMAVAQEQTDAMAGQPEGTRRFSALFDHKATRWAGAVVATIGLAYGAGFVAWEISKKATPTELIEATNPRGYTEDGRLRVASFNVQHHPERYAKQIDALIKDRSLDAVNLQESFLGRDKELHKRMGGKYWMVFAEANPRTGQGNTIITRAKPESYGSVNLPGTTYNETIINGISQIGEKVKDHEVSGDLSRIDENLQEPRSALEVTIKVLIGDKYVPVTVVDSHITGNKFPDQHRKQFNGLLKFVDSHTSDGKVTVVCADFNSDGNEVANAFADHRFRSDQNTLKTTLDPNQESPLDHCAYREKGVEQVGSGVLTVNPKIASDHKLIEMDFDGINSQTNSTADLPFKYVTKPKTAQSKTKVLTVRPD